MSDLFSWGQPFNNLEILPQVVWSITTGVCEVLRCPCPHALISMGCFQMTEATEVWPVRQAATIQMNRLLQAAAVTFQVSMVKLFMI